MTRGRPSCRRAAAALVAGTLLAPASRSAPFGVSDLEPGIRAPVEQLVEDRARLDRTVWREEFLAQEHEQVFVALWDRLRASSDPLRALGEFPFRRIVTGAPGDAEPLALGIKRLRWTVSGATRDPAAWRLLVGRLRAGGWRLMQSEWHHDDFKRAGPARRSAIRAALDLANRARGVRLQLRLTLAVTWLPRDEDDPRRPPPAVDGIEVVKGEALERADAPAFVPVLDRVLEGPEAGGNSTLIAADLDGDGRAELIYPGANAVFWNLGGGAFRQDTLLERGGLPIRAAVMADFTGDGQPDLLVTAGFPRSRLMLYPAGGEGRPAAGDAVEFDRPAVITAGDVNGDGALDVFIGQYKPPYVGGQMPTPYFDANDGFPCALLLNDGHGRFRDATAAAGLAAKRRRRTYGASFVDLDGDGRLDLVVVNDFAGADVYRNDGRGHFTDVTATALDEPASFGMSLAVDDFDRDGRLDLYVTGMASTTARRLEAMGLTRRDRPEIDAMRPRMGYGNRLFLGDDAGRFAEPAFRDQVARSGWSWGVAGTDVDNDGFRDLYITNGHVSGASARDYCTRFWCHDIYTDGSRESPVLHGLLALSTSGLRDGAISWNGYEKNVLYLNRGGREYVNTGFLLNAADERDCLNLVADDFDLDGRPDLAYLHRVPPDPLLPGVHRVGLRVLMNRIATSHHWIGVRLQGAPGVSPVGARITVMTPAGPRVGVCITGDSWRAQQAPVKQFGLGASPAVDRVEVRWANGAVSRLDRPKAGRYHTLRPG